MNATKRTPVHGTDPVNLIEKIVRDRIVASIYWKEQCFALTSESIVDKAAHLEYVGGSYGGNQRPSPFVCLLLKLLQLQPDEEIIFAFIKNKNLKYLTVLAAVYFRMVGAPNSVYMHLEPLLKDFRKIRLRTAGMQIRLSLKHY